MADFTETRFDYSAGRVDAPELTVMVGVSGSGKSVAAKGWVNYGRGTVIRLNRDNLRAMMYCDVPWSNYNEELTRRYEREGIKLALRMGRSVIVDDTNCSMRVRHELEEIARDCRVRFRLVTMTTAVEECIERDSKRSGKECVGRDVIEKQLKQLNAASVVPRAYGLVSMNRAVTDMDALRNGDLPLRLPSAQWVICDIDGTLADHTGVRGPFEEHKVLLDRPYPVVVEWVQALYPHYNVAILSGRHNTCGTDTEEWLQEYHIPHDALLMREAGCMRPDNEIKSEILHSLLKVMPKHNVAFVLDDRPKVIEKCWKANGIKVFPVRGTTEHRSGCTPEFDKTTRRCVHCGALDDF